MVLPEAVGCGDEILHVRSKIGAGKIPAAAAQPGEIEAQYRDTVLGQCGADIGRCLGFLGAREAVREQGICKRRGRGRRERKAKVSRQAWQFLAVSQS